MDQSNASNKIGEVIDETENLFRVVKRSRPNCITTSGSITPALFKDTNGISVDRDGGRTDEDSISFIINITFPRRAKAIAKFSALVCYEVQARIEAAPSSENPFHANIYLDNDEKKGNIQALQLADACSVVYFNDDMNWT